MTHGYIWHFYGSKSQFLRICPGSSGITGVQVCTVSRLSLILFSRAPASCSRTYLSCSPPSCSHPPTARCSSARLSINSTSECRNASLTQSTGSVIFVFHKHHLKGHPGHSGFTRCVLVSICSTLCHSRPVWLSCICRTKMLIFLNNCLCFVSVQ